MIGLLRMLGPTGIMGGISIGIVFVVGLVVVGLVAQRDAARAELATVKESLTAEMADHSATLSLLAETRRAMDQAQAAADDSSEAELRLHVKRRPVRERIAALAPRELTDEEAGLYRLIDDLAGGVLEP